MGRKVLVVDDERMIADTLGLIFTKKGFECRVSYNAAQAISDVEDFCPELLLCDVSMPDMEGLQLVSRVMEKCPDCRVLLLTPHYGALGSARNWARKQAKPSRVLTKPILPALLLQEADALLHRTDGSAND